MKMYIYNADTKKVIAIAEGLEENQDAGLL